MLAADVRTDLRLAVHAFRATQPRRVHDPVLRVGDLVGAQLDWEIDEETSSRDAGMRTEIAVALIHRSLTVTDRPAAWLTRAGVPQPHDLDMAWIPVLHRAFGMLEVAPRAVAVVTKTGWYDPLNEDGATWQRLRVRRKRPV
ncbi:MAG TPA: hypothetical protein VIR30_06380 [Nocardioides sp.]